MSSSTITVTLNMAENFNPLPPAKAIQFASHGDFNSQVDLEMHTISNERQVVVSGVGASQPSQGGRYLGSGVASEISPVQAADQIQTIWNPYKNRFRVLAACFAALANGMNDAAPGALIASLENDYNIGYGTVSTIFLCNALGFITAAFFISSLARRIGRAKSLMISEALLIVGYTVLVITPPFPVVAVSFFILGVGMAMNLAIDQVYCANLANNTALVGLYQGSYGIGGIIAPLIATLLVSKGHVWSQFYFIELGLAGFNFVFSAWAFWNYELESDPNWQAAKAEDAARREGIEMRRGTSRKWKSLKTLTSNKPTVLGAFFIFAYQGAEVAISGWIISFLVQFRHGDPSKVGYVTAGFWGGITLGRFTLSFLAHKIGERLFVFIVTVGASHSILFGNSVSVALSGLLLGPMYPCAVHIFERLIPRNMQISSLSLIGSVGSSGGAVAPFMTGMIAQQIGTFVLHPICIGLFVCMGAAWWLLPKAEKRPE